MLVLTRYLMKFQIVNIFKIVGRCGRGNYLVQGVTYLSFLNK